MNLELLNMILVCKLEGNSSPGLDLDYSLEGGGGGTPIISSMGMCHIEIGREIIQFWSRMGYNLPEKWPVTVTQQVQKDKNLAWELTNQEQGTSQNILEDWPELFFAHFLI